MKFFKQIFHNYLFSLRNVKFSNWVGNKLVLNFVCVLPVMLNILSTGDEDGTKQKIIFAISHKTGKSFSLSLKNSNGPCLAIKSWSLEKYVEPSYFCNSSIIDRLCAWCFWGLQKNLIFLI